MFTLKSNHVPKKSEWFLNSSISFLLLSMTLFAFVGVETYQSTDDIEKPKVNQMFCVCDKAAYHKKSNQ